MSTAMEFRSSSSFPSKEKVNKTVYLRMNTADADKETTDWYTIKLSSEDLSGKKRKKKERIGAEEPSLLKSIRRDSKLEWLGCSVGVGSTIYCTTANGCKSSTVIAVDTSNFTTSTVGAMNFARDAFESVSVAGNGKIYTFGGLRQYWWLKETPSIDNEFLVEVFDPTKNKWGPIYPPPPPEAVPFLLTESDLFAVYDGASGNIIVGSLSALCELYAYNPRGGKWSILTQKVITSPESRDPSRRSLPICFENTIYWIQIDHKYVCNSGLYAYNLDEQKLIYGAIIGLHPYFWGCFGNQMQIHHFRDNDFFLIWLDEDGLLVRCERIRVFKGEGSLTAYVLSTQAYKLDTVACGIGSVLL